MTIGLLGRKIGMTRVFTAEGVSIPISVVEVLPNRVSQIKTIDSNGYAAVQLVGGTKKSSHVNKPLTGHFAKAQIDAGDMLCEFRVDNLEGFSTGQIIAVNDVFNEGQFVDVAAKSKGKGFAGTVKRHNFATQDATHGNSRSHRVPGSIGQNQTPRHVFKGKKMAGHLGNVRCTTQNLEVVRIDTERNLLLIKGAIPGCPGARVEVRPATKKKAEGK
jgi:large subunit ribosomal protein L3